MRFTRREILARSAKAVSAAAFYPEATGLLTFTEQSAAQGKKLKVVVTGGHPGDPECGCGGTIARYTAAGHEAVLLYLNRGEGYCGQKALNECAAIRTKEAEQACALLNAHPIFAGQYDGRAIIDPSHYEEFSKLLLGQRPDLVFTHWPVDAHRDHRAISALVLDAWVSSNKKFALYYYEVAEDTQAFTQTDFVDTTAQATRHRDACFAHASQQPEKWFPLQEEIVKYHGLQHGCGRAEAFYRVSSPSLFPVL